MRLMRARVVATGITLLAATLAGCGNGDKSSKLAADPADRATPPTALSEVVGHWTVTVPGSAETQILTIGTDQFVLWLDCGYTGGSSEVSPSGLFITAQAMWSSKCGTPAAPSWLVDADRVMKVDRDLELRRGDTLLARLRSGATPPPAADIGVEYVIGKPDDPRAVQHFNSLGAPELPTGWEVPSREALNGTWDPVLTADTTIPANMTIDGTNRMRMKDGCSGGGGRFAYALGEVVIASYPQTTQGCAAGTAPISGWTYELRGFGMKDDSLGFFAEDGTLIGQFTPSSAPAAS